METITIEGKRHLEAALRRRQGFQAHAYSVAPFALPVLAVALVAPGRSLSAEGGTPRRGDASALARIRWPEGAKGKVSGDSCEPHPFPTWLRRPGEEHRLPVPVAGVVGSGRRGVGWGGGVCTTLGNLVWGKGENCTKGTWEPHASPFLLCRFFYSFYSFVLHLCAEHCNVFGCILGSGAECTGGSGRCGSGFRGRRFCCSCSSDGAGVAAAPVMTALGRQRQKD